MAELSILGQSLQISDSREAYNDYRLLFRQKADQAVVVFSDLYHRRNASLDDVVQNVPTQAAQSIRPVVEFCVNTLIEHGVLDIDTTGFEDRYGVYNDIWAEPFLKISDQYAEIVLDQKQLDEYRTARRQYRSRWRGGGFSLAGALRGAASAGMLNVITGAGHMLFNGVGKIVSSIAASRQKNKIFNSPETYEGIAKGVGDAAFALHLALIDCLAETGADVLPLSGAVSPQDARSATAILNNAHVMKDTKQRRTAMIQSFQLNPYWEARFTTGFDPATGKQKQRSITGKTQKEVAQKLRQATSEIDQGIYIEPSKMTVAQWADIWTEEYLVSVKPRTLELYQDHVRLYIKPGLGQIRLGALNPHTVQQFYNRMSRPRGSKPGLKPKTIKNLHGVLHRCLQQAVAVGYMRTNPADVCTLPRIERGEIHPLSDKETAAFLRAIRGSDLEYLFTLALYTGMREGELLGLTWGCIDFETGNLTVKQQLSRRDNGRRYELASTKSGKSRTLTLAPTAVAMLKRQRAFQAERKLKAGSTWEDSELVFTNALGHYLSPRTVYDAFKRIMATIGRPDIRVHDLRHTYAVNALRAGDDVKTVQGNLGHATAAFTLDVYGHVTQEMKQASAERMERFMQAVSSK